MYRKPPEMTPELMKLATEKANEWVGKRIAKGDLPSDVKNTNPANSWLCSACRLSGPRMAGQAVTCQPCMSCESEEIYGSTATDLLCFKCSRDHSLCKRCAADILLREDRVDWPKPGSSA